jgi:hypothetical protein
MQIAAPIPKRTEMDKKQKNIQDIQGFFLKGGRNFF